jgi:dihydropteroate synthase
MRTSSPGATRIGPVTFLWGARTYLMGILNVTPDSFSGDGLLQGDDVPSGAPDAAPRAAGPGPAGGAPHSLGAGRAVERAVARARRMVDDGADILDVGGESTRPGHAGVEDAEELSRVVPVVRAIRAALPDTPISVDTTKAAVAAAALDAGADCINDVWGTSPSDALPSLAAERGAAYVLMHNRDEARYVDVVREVLADLQHGMDRALAAGVPWESIVVDPGIGFGKTMEHNLILLHDLAELSALGRPVLLGTSRKSTIGRVLGGLPPEERLEGTLATTALGIAAGVDIVRVHDVLPNARVARMCDAIVRLEEEARA